MRRLLRRLRSLPPESGAVVMGIGVLALDSRSVGLPALFWLLTGVAWAVWTVLAAAFLGRLLRDRRSWCDAASTPGALTAVAGTGVLGLGLATEGATWPAGVLLAVAVLLWSVLSPRVLAAAFGQSAVRGGTFLLCVAAQSVAALAAQLALVTGTVWLLGAGVCAAVVGLGLYGFVLVRFDFGQILRGSGDHWVVGGALAISVVSTGKLVEATQGLNLPVAWLGLGRSVDLVLLAAAVSWYAVLVVAECAAPRPRYDLRRWATVFPLGMTCAAGFAAAGVCGLAAVAVLARALYWPALVMMLLTGCGTVRRILSGTVAS